MVDPNEHEVAAMRTAGDMAGQYIDAIGCTDMARWSEPDWHSFIEVICGAYVEALLAQQSAINSAVAKVQGRAG
ncbi:DUF6511 domain-containing protein [Roseomonas sp. GC11]|uniref:DUF6511 domain-containing protein n=1 Tax=Roseomonas sp. GC11 TaxID=2950546 RepID=UPI00210AD85E|nr:DUF6511 domain-containing protein [Roseomonas sp. GC11]MCQ4159205.1 DUF6511 domain-containing protein [Roseomonas sp. GC11]